MAHFSNPERDKKTTKQKTTAGRSLRQAPSFADRDGLSIQRLAIHGPGCWSQASQAKRWLSRGLHGILGVRLVGKRLEVIHMNAVNATPDQKSGVELEVTPRQL